MNNLIDAIGPLITMVIALGFGAIFYIVDALVSRWLTKRSKQ